jgi:hypothetical protein
VGESSEFYKYYPDGLICSAHTNQPDWRETWRGDRVFYLDATHHDGEHFLREIFETLAYRDGFEVFEVGFAYAGAVEGVRSNRALSPAGAFNQGIHAIRAAIGDSRVLLLSGTPLGAGAGLVDMAYSTPECGLGYRDKCGTLSTLQSALARAFLGAHAPVLSPSPIPTDPSVTDSEFRMIVTAAALSGAPLTLTGLPGQLTAERANLIQQALPAPNGSAVALDLFDRTIPQLLGLRLGEELGGGWVVGIFNTGDRPEARELDFARMGWAGERCHVYDADEGEYIGLQTGALTLEAVPAHSCRLVTVHKDMGRPQFLAADAGLTQGTAVVKSVSWQPTTPKHGTLAIALAQPDSRQVKVHVATPPGIIARSATSRNGRVHLDRSKSAANMLTIEATFRDQCFIEVVF